MTKTTTILLGVILVVSIGCVTLLAALGRDVESIAGFLTTAILPTIVALYAGNKADKAETAAKTAANNTNGRMSELLGMLHSLTGTIPEGYDDIAQRTGITPPNVPIVPRPSTPPDEGVVWDSSPGAS